MMLLPLILALPAAVLALPTSSTSTVLLDIATVTGVDSGNVTKFLGIPYATAPRFRLPVSVPLYVWPLNATSYGPSCPQQVTTSASRRSFEESGVTNQFMRRDDVTESEDCLTVNVIRPSGTKENARLPVVVWIYGGGFEFGTTVQYDTQSTRIVTKSIAAGTPVIHVSMNYRVAALGFLASQEVKDEGLGNFGLYDQRAALQWVNEYIYAFGGDPNKVTIWGQSAGAISASLQMLAFGGTTSGLFRGAFMQSGAPVPVGDITSGQKYYDALVVNAGCSNATDTLDCLRNVSYDTIVAATNQSPALFSATSLALAWTPRVDGVFIRDHPFKLIAAGEVAKIPVVSGNCDDEGTVFSVAQNTVLDEASFQNYVSTNYVSSANASELLPLWTNYPANASAGSPFDTGDANQLTPEYKRLAAFQGDLVFQAPRRFFLQSIAGRQKVWSYLNKYLKTYSPYGSYHSSDLDIALTDDFVIRFTNTLNPNYAGSSAWPRYTTSSPQLLTFADGAAPSLSADTYRSDPMNYLNALSLAYPL